MRFHLVHAARTRFWPGLFLYSAVAALAPAQDVVAQELGHYSPALPKIRDFVVPPPGNYFVGYNLYYTTDTFKNRDGVAVRSIQIEGETITLDTTVDSFITAPTYIRSKQGTVYSGQQEKFLLLRHSTDPQCTAILFDRNTGI